MDMPPPTLHAYADVPVIVQSRAASSPLLVDAVKAMTDARVLSIRVPAAPKPDVPDAAGKLPNEPLADEPIAEADYEALLSGMRARLDREMPHPVGYSVTVLDNSVIGGARADADARFGKGSVASRTFGSYYALKGGVPLSGTVQPSSGTQACVIMGPAPSMTIGSFDASGYGGKASFGRATAREYQGWVHWHEFGHCLFGPSETAADTFGLLMQIRDGASRDLVSAVATLREGNELLSTNERDDYFVAGAAGWLARNYDRLRADAAFMTADLDGVAQMAKGVSDRFVLDERTQADHKMVRMALAEAERRPEHLVRRADGTSFTTDFDGWLAANMDRVPVLGRVVDLRARRQEGPSRLPKPFVIDAAGMLKGLAQLASQGDPTAKAMIAKVTSSLVPLPEPTLVRSPWHVRDDRHMADALLRADPPAHDPKPPRVHVVSVDEEEAPSHRP